MVLEKNGYSSKTQTLDKYSTPQFSFLWSKNDNNNIYL